MVMEEIDSHHQEDPVASEEYSTDGRSNWQKIPAGIRVLGSKYALVLDKIEQVDLQFDLAKSRVAVGRKVGRAGSAYIKGRVDKACLEVTEMPVDPEQSIIKRITTPTGRGYCRGRRYQVPFMAELFAPYCVRLADGVAMPASLAYEIAEIARTASVPDWIRFVDGLKATAVRKNDVSLPLFSGQPTMAWA